jgi:hypothetical protein
VCTDATTLASLADLRALEQETWDAVLQCTAHPGLAMTDVTARYYLPWPVPPNTAVFLRGPRQALFLGVNRSAADARTPREFSAAPPPRAKAWNLSDIQQALEDVQNAEDGGLPTRFYGQGCALLLVFATLTRPDVEEALLRYFVHCVYQSCGVERAERATRSIGLQARRLRKSLKGRCIAEVVPCECSRLVLESAVERIGALDF